MNILPELRLKYESGIPELRRARQCAVALHRSTLRIHNVSIPIENIRELAVIRAMDARGGTISRGIVGTVVFGPLGGVIGALSARDAAKTFAVSVRYTDAHGGEYVAALTGHIRDMPRMERIRQRILQQQAEIERWRVGGSLDVPKNKRGCLSRLILWAGFFLLLFLAAIILLAVFDSP